MPRTTDECFVYRIETAEGGGPYRGSDWEYWKASEARRHPTPFEDPELGYDAMPMEERKKYSFGFSSMEQLTFWFYRKEWREQMQAAGLRVTKWLVPEGLACMSCAQAIFRRDLSTLVETSDLP